MCVIVFVINIANYYNILIDNYQKVFLPGEDIVVDKTMVPLRGRLIFRQYIPTKSHISLVYNFSNCAPPKGIHGLRKYILDEIPAAKSKLA